MILLERRNKLKQFVSLELARLSEVWGHNKPEDESRRDATTFALDSGDTEAFFTRCQRAVANAREWFSRHELFHIQLEELIAQHDERLRSLQMFLGTDYQPMPAGDRQQNRRSLPEIITNYAELKTHFAGTEWAGYFDA